MLIAVVLIKKKRVDSEVCLVVFGRLLLLYRIDRIEASHRKEAQKGDQWICMRYNHEMIENF